MLLSPADRLDGPPATDLGAPRGGSPRADPREEPQGRWTAWLLLVAGAVGLLASFVLAVEKYAVLADPGYVPTCSLNPVISCGTVMSSPQAELLGFPNPLLGIAGFSVLVTCAVAMLAGARPPAWFWWGLQAGVTAGVALVHWLIYTSLYRLGALCPYCMAVWVVTIVAFWYVSLHNLRASTDRLPARARGAVSVLHRHHGVVLTVWFLLVATAITERFWLYWSTLVG